MTMENQRLPFSIARQVGDLIFFSGAIPINELTNEIINSTLEAEVAQTMKNIKTDLEKYGLNFDDIVDITVFLKDLSDLQEFNKYYLQYFDNKLPTRALVGGVDLVGGVRVELKVIAQCVQ